MKRHYHSICTTSAKYFLSTSSKVPSSLLSMSSTATMEPSFHTGTTISLLLKLEQAICPGNLSTSGTITVSSRSQHTLPFLDARTCQRTLERTKDKEVSIPFLHPIESRPPEPERLMQHARHIRHVRNQIRLALHHRSNLWHQFQVLLFLRAFLYL